MLFPIEDVFDIKYEAELLLHNIYGGMPANPQIMESWIRSVLVDSNATQIRNTIIQNLIERHQGDIDNLANLSEDELVEVIKEHADLMINGFKRTEDGELAIEGRQVKAMIKEAANTAVAQGALPARGWGKTNKGLMGYLPEHIFVPTHLIPLGVTEPTGVDTNFVHTWRGDSIKREEYVENALVTFTVVTDHDFGDDFWREVWTRAQLNGLGASRSQSRGQFEVKRWDRL